MPLLPGARLGAYEVVAQLGAGGMGEVYRARDTRLDRDVAIKVLPPHLAMDEAARARFEREAKAIAALSHPNILAVYDVGRLRPEGASASQATNDDVAYVVMELLEGETLRQRLAQSSGAGGMPIRKVTQIGIEIAQGLAAAHEKQIVHRDVKPENVFLAADGRVKILDFGLARQVAGKTADIDTQLQQTDPGTVMGTVGYMAPEQIKAATVDHRADIFSLGCVLYEMAAGRRPFARETAAETMTAILREEPADLVRESGVIPAAFEPIVRHCLEKRPEERFQSARDLAFALQSLGTGSATAAPVSVPSASAVASDGVPHRRIPAAAMIGVAVLALAAFFLGRQTSGGSTAAVAGAPVVSFQQVTDTPGVETEPSLSPDGKTVVFTSDREGSLQIYAQRVGSRVSTALTSGGADSHNAAFSPEGERIAFRSERDGGGIFVMTATGESVNRVSAAGHSPSWSPEGKELVLSRGAFFSPTDVAASAPGLFAVELSSGKTRDVLRGTQPAMQPAWSPHGHRIAYFSLRANSGQRDIFTVAADGSGADSPPMEVTNDPAVDWNPVWSPDGAHLYFSSNRGGTTNLWRIAINEVTGRTLGSPEPFTTPSIYSGRMSFSKDGSAMVYASVDWRSTLLRQNFDASRGERIGTPTPLLKGSRPIRDHAISPNGEWLVFNEFTTREDLFVARVDGREYRRLTDDEYRDRGPVWARDGQSIYFYSDRSGTYDLWSIKPVGGQPAAVTKGLQSNFPTVSPDGRRYATAGVSIGGLVIRNVDAALDEPARFEPEPRPGERLWPYSWSTGNVLLGLLISREGGMSGIGTYDIATKQYRTVSSAYTYYAVPLWLRDGRRFVVRSASGIDLVDSQTGARKQLTAVRGYMIGRSLDVSADNTWYSYTETGTEGDIWIAKMK